MNKKGSHVDWAISMGIFLIYIMGMFILLRPGVTPVYKPEGLLELLKDKFDEQVMYEVREIPLIIDVCKGVVDGANVNKNEIGIKDTSENFQFSKVRDENGNDLNPDEISGSKVLCGVNEEAISDKSYYFTYYQVNKGITNANLEIDCETEEEEFCSAMLGASITKIGINTVWLNNLKPKVDESMEVKYREIKEEWKFPEDKDFSIYVASSEEDLINNKIIGAVEPQGANLFIKQFKTQEALETGGIVIPTFVNIRVW